MRLNTLARHFPQRFGIFRHGGVGHAIQTRGAIAATRDPTTIKQRFQMATRGALRNLHNARQLANAQFLIGQKLQHAQTNNITKRRELAQ